MGKKVIFQYERDKSPEKDLFAKASPEKEEVQEELEKEEFMFYSKEDINALLGKIQTLQIRVENISESQKDTISKL